MRCVMNDLSLEVLSQILKRTTGAALRCSLVCHALRAAQRELRTTVVVTEGECTGQLHWALSSLPNFKLEVLAKLADDLDLLGGGVRLRCVCPILLYLLLWRQPRRVGDLHCHEGPQT